MRILITGANGLLGTKAMQVFSRQHDVTGMDREHDITQQEAISFILRQKPDLIVHAAAETNVDACELHPEQAYTINVLGTENVIKAARVLDAKLVYISSDFVFDGSRGNYTEADQPNPINQYGRTKWAAEQKVAAYENSLIIRSAVLYGHNPGKTHYNFAEWVISSLMQEKGIRVVPDQINSPALIDDLAAAVLALREQTGTVHVAGPSPISRYEFALQAAEVFGLPKALITPVTSAEFPQAAPRPRDAGLSVEKARSLGIRLSSAAAGLSLMKAQRGSP